MSELDKLTEVLESIVYRLANKPDRTPEESQLLIDAQMRLSTIKTFLVKEVEE